MILIRLFVLCLVATGFVYLPAILGFAAIAAPEKSKASIIAGPDGRPVGSRLVAQGFSAPRYFHPRPSACDYDGAAAAGSNLSPANPALGERARAIAAEYGATPDQPIPADLVTASGSGLDPDISLAGALYQVRRVAEARGLEEADVRATVGQVARPLVGSAGAAALVNVLELNLALDRQSR